MEYFSKKYRQLKSKILHKFHCLLFVFYFFCILVIFFSYFTYPNLSKNTKHFCGALLYVLQILSENSRKFLNFYLKKQRYFKYKTFQEFHCLLCAFLIFLVFLTSFFSILPVYGFQKKKLKFLCCFIVWIRDFIKKLYKTIVFLSKKFKILEIKNVNKILSFTISFLFFILFGILFSISPMQTCPKIMEFFVVFYWKGQRFYR